MNHCDTCICNEYGPLDKLNALARKVVKAGPIRVYNAELLDRLSDSPLYQFGFRDFLPSQENSKVIGMFLAAVRERDNPKKYRYFGVLVGKPGGAIKPFEYRAGDCFDISVCDAWHREDGEDFGEVSEEFMASWLRPYSSALYSYVLYTLRLK